MQVLAAIVLQRSEDLPVPGSRPRRPECWRRWMNRGVFSAIYMAEIPLSYWYSVQHIREHLVVLVHFL